MPNQHNLATIETREPANDCVVVCIITIAAQRNEILKRMLNEIAKMRALRMARHLRLLPRGQGSICAGKQVSALALEPQEFLRNIYVIAFCSGPKLCNTLLKLRDRLLEFEIRNHEKCASRMLASRQEDDAHSLTQPNVPHRHACRFVWSQYPHGRAKFAAHANRHRLPVNG